MIGWLIIIAGFGISSAAWHCYDKYPTKEDFFLEIGSLGFWLVVLGIIFLIWG